LNNFAIGTVEPTQNDYKIINQVFNLCGNGINNTKGIQSLIDWLTTAHSYMAMTDYPYPTSFL
jgi:hypothetical protein